jgi:hypothetical protein
VPRLRRTAAIALALLSVLAIATPVAANSGGSRCVRFVASQFDAPGEDFHNPNGEWVRIKNHCASEKALGGWRVHDYSVIRSYRFTSGVRIGPGKTITLFSGQGDDTASKKYRGARACWNNEPPEWAYLRKPDGTLVLRWTEY